MGDVITKIGETSITSLEDLSAAKKKYVAGDTAVFTIYRDGKEQTVELTFDTAPRSELNEQESQTQQPSGGNDSYGGYYYNPWDFFNEFFGGRYYGSAA